MKLKRPIVFALCSLLVMTASAHPHTIQAGHKRQSENMLKPFQSVTGQLGEGLVLEEWKFEGQAGQIISLVAERISGDLDVVLTLLNPNAEVIATNDNADFETTDARLEAISLGIRWSIYRSDIS